MLEKEGGGLMYYKGFSIMDKSLKQFQDEINSTVGLNHKRVGICMDRHPHSLTNAVDEDGEYTGEVYCLECSCVVREKPLPVWLR